jgi:hypothetical protein
MLFRFINQCTLPSYSGMPRCMQHDSDAIDILASSPARLGVPKVEATFGIDILSVFVANNTRMDQEMISEQYWTGRNSSIFFCTVRFQCHCFHNSYHDKRDLGSMDSNGNYINYILFVV